MAVAVAVWEPVADAVAVAVAVRVAVAVAVGVLPEVAVAVGVGNTVPAGIGVGTPSPEMFNNAWIASPVLSSRSSFLSPLRSANIGKLDETPTGSSVGPLKLPSPLPLHTSVLAKPQQLVSARSGRLSPLRSATCKPLAYSSSGVSIPLPKLPLPSPRNTQTLLPKLCPSNSESTTMSKLPSLLTSAIATALGKSKVFRVLGAWKVPSPFPDRPAPNRQPDWSRTVLLRRPLPGPGSCRR